ncbi:MAG: hypothetical protein MUO63_01340 [Desulfobulbaceae bacterium]|nr:hypothetical protein [Desulfobulbaceae bacterium]
MRKWHYDVLKIEKAFQRRFRFKFPGYFLLCLTTGITLFGPLNSIVYGGGNAIDICKIIPGDEVAKAIYGKIVETKSLDGRCVYIVEFKESDVPRRAFVIYQHEASDFDSLRDSTEGEVKHLTGLGDEAVISFDGELKRYWLLVVKRGQVTYQVSGDNEDLVRKVAGVALKKLAP